MIPLYHDFDGDTVLVFGGGAVGLRKARRFAREAQVVVVSPAFDDGFDDLEAAVADGALAGGLERVRETPDVDDVDDWLDRTSPALVVAATDDGAINAAAEAAARQRDVLINRTDRSGGRDAGSVVVPATIRDDPVTVAISTGGASPALSRHLRETIETEIEDAGAMAELTGEIREELQAQGAEKSERHRAIRAVVRAPQVWKALQEGPDKAREEAETVLRTTRNA